MTLRHLVLATLSIPTGLALAAPAAPAPSFSVGGLIGPGFVSSGGGTRLVFGAEGMYRLPVFDRKIDAGLYFTYNSLGSFNAGAAGSLSSSMVNLAAQANYRFDELISGLSAGAKFGLNFLSSSTSGTVTVSGGSTSTNLVLGPSVSYDYPIGYGLTAGAEANFLVLTNSAGTTVFNLLGALKYHF